MADNKGGITIIKKKKGGGGHGHHGGAWKVAYADFVTAMMAFFLVMWLMGSDEETKAAIAHYFNHPNTPFDQGKDPKSDTSYPMGESEGIGDMVLQGLAGENPDDLVPNPQRESGTPSNKDKEVSDKLNEALQGHVYALDIQFDTLKFSIPENVLFKPGTAELSPQAGQYLSKLSNLFKNFKGYISIDGNTDETQLENGRSASPYEISMSKAVAIMKYYVDRRLAPEDKFTPMGSGFKKKYTADDSPEGRQQNRRIEFTLTREKKI